MPRQVLTAGAVLVLAFRRLVLGAVAVLLLVRLLGLVLGGVALLVPLAVAALLRSQFTPVL